MSSIHGNLYNLLLSRVYGRYGVLNDEVVELVKAGEGGREGHRCETGDWIRQGHGVGTGVVRVVRCNRVASGEQEGETISDGRVYSGVQIVLQEGGRGTSGRRYI